MHSLFELAWKNLTQEQLEYIDHHYYQSIAVFCAKNTIKILQSKKKNNTIQSLYKLAVKHLGRSLFLAAELSNNDGIKHIAEQERIRWCAATSIQIAWRDCQEKIDEMMMQADCYFNMLDDDNVEILKERLSLGFPGDIYHDILLLWIVRISIVKFHEKDIEYPCDEELHDANEGIIYSPECYECNNYNLQTYLEDFFWRVDDYDTDVERERNMNLGAAADRWDWEYYDIYT